ncbi:MAG: hypothetical protein R3E50_02470 [Halioglobus sp.]
MRGKPERPCGPGVLLGELDSPAPNRQGMTTQNAPGLTGLAG